jgi:hypothetical protein
MFLPWNSVSPDALNEDGTCVAVFLEEPAYAGSCFICATWLITDVKVQGPELIR